MAVSDDNARRAHEAEIARQIASGETVAFFTTLLAVLNEAEAAPRVVPREQTPPALEPAPPPVAPEPSANEIAPADIHHDGHADASAASPSETATTVHADAEPAHEPHQVATETGASPGTEPTSIHVAPSSPLLFGLDAAAGRALSHDVSNSHGITSTASAPEPIAPVVETVDPAQRQLDGVLATVSHAISDVTGTLGQLTASLTGTINHVTSTVTDTINQLTSTVTTGTITHLTDSVTGLASNLIHNSPVTAVVQPLVTDSLGSPGDTAQHAPDHSQPAIPLLDTAGVAPTALLHPLPLHLGFLGQQTLDGHDPHDGAFSALGVHHF